MANNSVKIGLEIAIGQAKTALESFFNGFKKNLGEADRATEKLNKTTSGLEMGLKRLFPLVTAGALVKFAKDAINTADSFDDLAQKTGFAVESMAAFNAVAEIEGIQIEKLSTYLSKFSVQVVQAKNGVGDMAEVFGQLGVTLTGADGNLRTMEDILTQTMDAFASMPDGIEKTALALEIFGKGSKDIIPLLNQGSDGLRKAREDAKAFGNEIGTNTAKRAADFNDNLTRLKLATQGLFQTLISGIIPALQTLSESFVDIARTGGGFASVIGLAADIFNGLVASGYLLVGVLASIGDAFIGVSSALVRLVTGDLQGAKQELLTTADVLEDRFEKTFNRIAGVFGLNPMAARESGSMLGGGGDDAETADKTRAQKEIESRIKAQRDLEEKLIESARTLGDARAEAETTAFVARLETEGAKLDEQYGQGLVSLEQYYAERLRLTQETLDTELKLLNQQLDAANAARRKAADIESTEGGIARNKAEAEQQKAIAAIIALGERRKQAELKIESDIAAAKKQIRDAEQTQALARVRAEQSRVQNDPTLLRVERTRQLLPLLERELELLKQQEVQALNLQRISGSPSDQIAAQQQLLEIEQRRADIRTQQGDLARPDSFGGSLISQFTEFANEMATTSENLAAILVAPFIAMEEASKRALSEVLKGNMTVGDAVKSVWNSIVSGIIDSFANMVVEWVMSHVLMKGVAMAYKAFTSGMRKADVAEANATEVAKTPALAANATLASIGSWGIAVAIGIAAIAGILASIGAFEQGGVVAGGEQIIRVNENGQESVINARGTRNLGQGMIDRINAGLVSASDLSGMGMDLTDSMARGIPDSDGMAMASESGGEGNISLTVIVVDSDERALEAMKSAKGRAILVDLARGNQPEYGIPG